MEIARFLWGPRISGDMLEAALVFGITCGVDAVLVG